MTRDTITSNELGSIPTLPVFVGFTIGGQETPFPAEEIPSCLEKIFGSTNSMSVYYKEISYTSGAVKPHNIVLTQEKELSVVVFNAPSDYNWGYLPSEFESAKPKKLTCDVFREVLQIKRDIPFQDRFVILILNCATEEIGGRGAMCLVPGVTPQPQDALPENQELFVGVSPRDNPQSGSSREAYFIDMQFKFPQYYTLRRDEFDNWSDEFVRGVCIFCKDSSLSCAVHDGIHALKRISSGIPTASFPGTRARAVPCLYNLHLQGEWLKRLCDRRVYCTPYIGWWDNTGDHLHPRLPRPFFSGPPYGVSAFTKMKLGVIPQSYIGTAEGTKESFQLYRLTAGQLPPQTGGQPVLVVKVPLSEGDNTKYLLVEHRRYMTNTVDGISVDVNGLLGNPATDPIKVNPPEYLVSDKGILIYHVDEEKPHLGEETTNLCPTGDSEFVQNFIMYVYTPSMFAPQGMSWDDRNPRTLKNAGFGIGSTFALDYPFDVPHLTIEIFIAGWDDNVASIEVRRTNI